MTSDPAPRPPLDKVRLTGPHRGTLRDVRVEVVDQLPSTNIVVAQRARSGAPEGLVVVADHQSAGRGRLDRSWESPAGSAVTFSILLRPTSAARSWPWLPLLTGYAVDRALRAFGLETGVKWPNDVLIGDKKVCGILVERIETSQGPAAIVGVGINVSTTAEELPVPHATSLEIELGRAVDRTDVLLEVLGEVRSTYDAWEAGDVHDGMRLAEVYAAACVTLGREVRVDLPDGRVLAGTASGIDPSGQLLVRVGGAVHAVSAGDVVHVRTRPDGATDPG
ncbi:MAG: biotin--[acetyl-CoA-carboxylase] ligase [Nocardioides sp.]